jgi:aspartate racemase
VSIVRRLIKDKQIDGLILGGTELPLLLRGTKDLGIPMLDTTKLHVEQVVTELLS